MSAPVTAAIPTGWRSRLNPKPALTRVRRSLPGILQIVVAATGAYVFAEMVLGHPTPLLAATVTVSSLGLVRDARPIRVLETVIGMLVGILDRGAPAARRRERMVAAGPGAGHDAHRGALPLRPGGLRDRRRHPVADRHDHPGRNALLPVRRRHRRRRGGAPGDGPRPTQRRAHRAARGSRGVRRGRRRGRRADPGAAPRRPPARRARAREGARSAAALRGLACRPGVRRRDRAHLALPAPPALRAAASRADPPIVWTSPSGICGSSRAASCTSATTASRDQWRPMCSPTSCAPPTCVAGSLDDIALEPIARESLLSIAARLDPRTIIPDAALGDQGLIAALRPLVVDLLTATGMPDADGSRRRSAHLRRLSVSRRRDGRPRHA